MEEKENLDRSLEEIEVISAEDRERMLVEWNATEAAYPEDKTVIDLFEEQVEKSPNSIAVVYEEEEITYRELNKRSNQPHTI